VHESRIPGATYAYWCVFAGVFVTAFYSFRLVFMTFHGPERFGHDEPGPDHHDEHHGDDLAHEHVHAGGKPHESPWVVTLPLVLLAIPSLAIGWYTIGPVLFGDYFGKAIQVAHEHDVLHHIGAEFHGPVGFIEQALRDWPVYLALAGVLSAWLCYIKFPDWPAKIANTFALLYKLFANKFYFDEFNQKVFAGGSVALGKGLWKFGDAGLIDGVAVNGSARVVAWLSGIVRNIQSGYLYSYAFTMIIGLAVLLGWYLWL
jgi:NADH-quinone oxidoreductase subunit L